jgi:predicted membrane protein
MYNKRQIIIGSLVIIFGLVLLLEAIFDIDIWALICPAALIGLGVWWIVRPRISEVDSDIHIFFAHNIRRRGDWTATNEEFWGFAIDLNLDLSETEIPSSESTIRTYGFVTELRLLLPEDVGLSVNTMAFVTEDRILGKKEDRILAPYSWKSENYATADRKLRIEANSFVVDVRVKASEPTSEIIE